MRAKFFLWLCAALLSAALLPVPAVAQDKNGGKQGRDQVAASSPFAWLYMKEVKLGTFSKSRNPVQQRTLVYKNTGDAPLQIRRISSSCPCIQGRNLSKTVQPGKTGKIRLTYNGTNQKPGKIKGFLTINSNAGNDSARCYIHGTMTE